MDLQTCAICTENLEIKNTVNTECNHQFCKNCFWKWIKGKNTCPFCRKSILYNSKEFEDLRNLRELLEHRSTIIKQVEKAYETKDRLDKHNSYSLKLRIMLDKKLISSAKTLDAFNHIQNHPWQAINMFKNILKNILIKKEEEARYSHKFLCMSYELSYNDNNPYSYSDITPLYILRELRDQKIRNKRKKFKKKLENIMLEQEKTGYGLGILFEESESETDDTDDDMPELEEYSDIPFDLLSWDEIN